MLVGQGRKPEAWACPLDLGPRIVQVYWVVVPTLVFVLCWVEVFVSLLLLLLLLFLVVFYGRGSGWKG